jgi:hypothetical protein
MSNSNRARSNGYNRTIVSGESVPFRCFNSSNRPPAAGVTDAAGCSGFVPAPQPDNNTIHMIPIAIAFMIPQLLNCAIQHGDWAQARRLSQNRMLFSLLFTHYIQPIHTNG